MYLVRVENRIKVVRVGLGRGETRSVSGSPLKVKPKGCPDGFSHHLWELR